MADIQTLQVALRSIISIRSKTAEIMKCASDGMTTKHGEEGKEKKFLSELKLQLDTINTQMKDLVFDLFSYFVNDATIVTQMAQIIHLNFASIVSSKSTTETQENLRHSLKERVAQVTFRSTRAKNGTIFNVAGTHSHRESMDHMLYACAL